MYKVGDKLICKKEFHPMISGHNFIKNFLIGCEYQVIEVYDDSVRLGNGSGYFFWFYISVASDFFYSVQDIRKKKLEQLKTVEDEL